MGRTSSPRQAAFRQRARCNPTQGRQPRDLTTLLVNAAMIARNAGAYREAAELLEDCLTRQRASTTGRASYAVGWA